MRDEVAYSVLLDMHEDGGYRHGFWSDDMETHSRFHLDGIELFISQYDLSLNKLWLDACHRGLSFLFNNLSDDLDEDMIWFLHDTLEDKNHHFFKSTIFGKQPGNSLCINTHTQALRVLHRMHRREPEETTYVTAYKNGMKALQRVLEYQPADLIYRFLVQWILNSHIMVNKSRLIRKVNTVFIRWFLKPIYWKAQQKYPRLVHSNGFIERDLSLSFVSDKYHITNVKELLKLYDLEKPQWLKPYIIGGLNFIKQYIAKKGLRNVLQKSPYYIEVMDIFALYSHIIEELPPDYMESINREITKLIGGGTSIEYEIEKEYIKN